MRRENLDTALRCFHFSPSAAWCTDISGSGPASERLVQRRSSSSLHPLPEPPGCPIAEGGEEISRPSRARILRHEPSPKVLRYISRKSPHPWADLRCAPRFRKAHIVPRGDGGHIAETQLKGPSSPSPTRPQLILPASPLLGPLTRESSLRRFLLKVNTGLQHILHLFVPLCRSASASPRCRHSSRIGAASHFLAIPKQSPFCYYLTTTMLASHLRFSRPLNSLIAAPISTVCDTKTRSVNLRETSIPTSV